jgi:hypothetical protein
MYDAGENTMQQIADTFGVSRPTIYRHLATAAAAEPWARRTPPPRRDSRATDTPQRPAELPGSATKDQIHAPCKIMQRIGWPAPRR